MDDVKQAQMNLMELVSQLKEHIDEAETSRSEAEDQAGSAQECADQAVQYLNSLESELDSVQETIVELNKVLNSLQAPVDYPTLAKFMRSLQDLVYANMILFPKLEEKKDAVEERSDVT